MKSDLKKLMKEYKTKGWEICQAKRGGHLVWTSPSGYKVFSSLTPSDINGIRQIRRNLEKYGNGPTKVKT